MGTRSTTTILDGRKKLITIYRQYDGYLSGQGLDLFKLLKGRKMVNGFCCNDSLKTAFNGVGELAAYLVMELKKDAATQKCKELNKDETKYITVTKKNCNGNIYIVPNNHGLEEYNYTISIKDNDIFIKCTDYDNNVILEKTNIDDLKKSNFND